MMATTTSSSMRVKAERMGEIGFTVMGVPFSTWVFVVLNSDLQRGLATLCNTDCFYTEHKMVNRVWNRFSFPPGHNSPPFTPKKMTSSTSKRQSAGMFEIKYGKVRRRFADLFAHWP